VKYKGLKRRAIRRKKGNKPPVYIMPGKKEKGGPYVQTKDYKYFWGHVTPEIAKQLKQATTICWTNTHMLSLSVCAVRKFWKEQSYCKRCSLFQGDEYAKQLRSLIEEWEKDDLKEE